MAAQFELKFTLGANTVSQLSNSYSDANGQRFSDYLWGAYPQLDENGDPLPDTNANRAQAFRDFADAIFEATKQNVLRHEKQAAKAAAEAGVGDIDPA